MINHCNNGERLTLIYKNEVTEVNEMNDGKRFVSGPITSYTIDNGFLITTQAINDTEHSITTGYNLADVSSFFVS